MMLTIVAVDKMREAYLRAGCESYVKRLARYRPVSVVETRKATGADACTREGAAILAQIGPDDVVWALDRGGTQLASEELERRLAALESSGCRRLVLAIGGAGGLHRSVLERASFRWSLSAGTFLHEMARLIVLEQLYRAAKIGRGEPYHR